MNLDRRQFLIGAGLLLSSCAVFRKPFSAAGEPVLMTGSPGFMHFIHLKDGRVESCALPEKFVSHSYIHDPARQRIWTLEKFGPRAAVVDVRSKTLRRLIDAPEGCEFYGHGALAPGGGQLLLATVDVADGRGFLSRVDLATERLRASDKITPGIVHDGLFMDDRTFVITSAGIRPRGAYKGGPPQFDKVTGSSLIFVDWPSQRPVREIPLEKDDEMVSHLAYSRKSKTMVVLSSTNRRENPGKGRIYFWREGESRLTELPLPENLVRRLKTEMLSVAIDEDRQIACVTHPNPGLVLTVDIARRELISSLDLGARGVIHEPKNGFFYLNVSATPDRVPRLGSSLATVDDSFHLNSPGPLHLDSSHMLLFESPLA